MAHKKIRILLVDDHALLREGLKRILADVPGLQVVGEASTAAEALKRARTMEWDVLVLDIALPGKSGVDILKQIRLDTPDKPVLILSMYPEDQYAIRVLKAGASGYLTKESAPNQLVTAIRKVANGGKYVSPALAEKLVGELDVSQTKASHEVLSDREFEIFGLIAQGKTPTQIAGTLNLSVKTVSTYRSRILNKMKMSTNAELIHYAVRNGLIN